MRHLCSVPRHRTEEQERLLPVVEVGVHRDLGGHCADLVHAERRTEGVHRLIRVVLHLSRVRCVEETFQVSLVNLALEYVRVLNRRFAALGVDVFNVREIGAADVDVFPAVR